VEGPGLEPSTASTGTSAIPESENASSMSAMPPPLEATMVFSPMLAAPSAMFMAASSLSGCITPILELFRHEQPRNAVWKKQVSWIGKEEI